MISYLVDTNVISEFSKPRINPDVKRWIGQADPDQLFASVVTLGEMRLGTERLPQGKRRSNLEAWLEHGLPNWFAANLLAITCEIADRWARITVQARRQGLNSATTDALIAATAFEHNLTLVTRNVKDFTSLGVAILNPWQPQSPSVPQEA